jgi:predicted GH43/DUF377 family glycosyl hydrolase
MEKRRGARKKSHSQTRTRKRRIRERSFQRIREQGNIRPPLIKYSKNPILSPNSENDWECLQTFNPGALLLDDKIHLIYRAIGTDWISRFGYAVSEDGFTITFRSQGPVYERKNIKAVWYPSPSGGGFGGCEDPRIVRVDDEDTIYMTYTAFGELRVGLTSIDVDDFRTRNWNWKPERLISPPGEVHKNFVLFPEKIRGKYAIIHSLSPEIKIEYRDTMEFSEGEYIRSTYASGRVIGGWELTVKSIGPPPIYTPYGWLVFYHSIDRKEPWKYKIGVMLLDKRHPEKIIYASRTPVIEPEKDYEYNGFKPGIVYSCGAVVKDKMLFVYYGGADNYTCVAYADFKEFLKSMRRKEPPVMKKRKLVRRK